MNILIYMLCLIINTIVLTSIGYGIKTWQHWLSMACVVGAYCIGVCE